MWVLVSKLGSSRRADTTLNWSHRSQCFPSNMQFLGIEHRSSGLMASTDCVCMCVSVCVCVCVSAKLGCHFCGAIHLDFWDNASHSDSLISLDCPVSPRGPTFLCFPSTGALCPFIFMWVLGMELSFSLWIACTLLTDSHILLLVEGFFTQTTDVCKRNQSVRPKVFWNWNSHSLSFYWFCAYWFQRKWKHFFLSGQHLWKWVYKSPKIYLPPPSLTLWVGRLSHLLATVRWETVLLTPVCPLHHPRTARTCLIF